jgi:cobaltochelatase CobS
MLYDPTLIVKPETRHIAIGYLVGLGHHDAELALLGNVALMNLYHEAGGEASPSNDQLDAARIAIATAQALGIGAEGLRAIVREEIASEACREAVLGHLAALAPRKLEVVSPRGSVVIEERMHYRTELVIQVVGLGDAVMMVGPAGCGKTTIGEHTAKALQLPFYITSTINDTHELIGFVDGHGKYHDTPFRNAYEHGGVWVGDEVDAWDAAALLAANSALANGICAFPDSPLPVRQHADFRAVMTANTYGTGADRMYVGRNELDAASLDRFAMIEVDYDIELERMFAGDQHKWLEHVWKVRKIVNEKRIRHVVSSRAIAKGARALANGMRWETVNALYLMKGISAADRKKVEA